MTILVAIEGEQKLPIINCSEDLTDALQKLGSLPADSIQVHPSRLHYCSSTWQCWLYGHHSMAVVDISVQNCREEQVMHPLSSLFQRIAEVDIVPIIWSGRLENFNLSYILLGGPCRLWRCYGLHKMRMTLWVSAIFSANTLFWDLCRCTNDLRDHKLATRRKSVEGMNVGHQQSWELCSGTVVQAGDVIIAGSIESFIWDTIFLLPFWNMYR